MVEYITEFYDDSFAHDVLDAKGIERNREWFRCDVETAIAAVNEAKDIPDYIKAVLDGEAEEQGEIVFT